ncbi:MAG: ABC transporter ATP-binding protein [Ruminococcus sp.]|nr:ABC transporter ATP-binding protein [Ruminococcus sp.]
MRACVKKETYVERKACGEKEKFTIEVEGVSRKFGKNQVLNQVSFAVEEGEIFGLLGPSGAGKTTLVKILTGQLLQDMGNARLLGRDTRKLGAAEHGQIGVMMDNFGLYDRLSVYDNLAFYADIYRVPRDGIFGMLKEIGLYDAKNRAVCKLSKGMKNRLSLARAMMNQARVLFLDEPTSGLDPVTMREIHRVLVEQKRKGTTIFLTTHNMFEAESLCNRVALLSKGSIVELGRPGDVCQKYNHLNKLRVTLKDGEEVLLENGGASAELMKEYLEENKIASVHSTEPTLESVFVELTGTSLMDTCGGAGDAHFAKRLV